jgi:probable F420-dependent oxidoreductase
VRFWLSVIAVREFEQLPQLARHAEQLGFHGLMVGDHLLWPAHIETRYPYTPDGKIFLPADTPWPDPWVLFAHLGAITTKLRFASNIYLAALRDPFTAAKLVATAALLTNDRVVCGVAAGWLKEEYDQAQIPFATRGARLDELIAVMRKLWTGQRVQHAGKFFRLDATAAPAPRRPVPIWCGGDAPDALRRAARNDGWLPLPMTVARALEMAARLRTLRAEQGLPATELSVGLPLAEPVTQAGIDTLRGAGLEDIVVIAPWLPSPWDVAPWVAPGDDISRLEIKQQALERYAASVIRRIH